MTRREKGGATMLLILVLLAFSALMGALAVRGATGDMQMSASQRQNRSAFYCAEAGLNAARGIISANFTQWNTMLAGGTPVGFTYPIVGDIDGLAGNDYSVTIKDNIDEFPPAANNPADNKDLTVIMVSTCISTTITGGAQQRTLEQIVQYSGNLGTDYRYQAGHSSTHSGNVN
jgi:PilX N-terminal